MRSSGLWRHVESFIQKKSPGVSTKIKNAPQFTLHIHHTNNLKDASDVARYSMLSSRKVPIPTDKSITRLELLLLHKADVNARVLSPVQSSGEFGRDFTPWKTNGWNLQPSPINRKEHDLNHPPPGNYGTQPSQGQGGRSFPCLENGIFLKKEAKRCKEEVSFWGIIWVDIVQPTKTSTCVWQKSPESCRMSGFWRW